MVRTAWNLYSQTECPIGIYCYFDDYVSFFCGVAGKYPLSFGIRISQPMGC